MRLIRRLRWRRRLRRFVRAQAEGTYERAYKELRQGRKATHWMWFIFPQEAGLGRSELSKFYAISSLDEARAYVEHPVLGPRLGACSILVLGHLEDGRSLELIFDTLDAIKFRSCMRLFNTVQPDDVYSLVLEQEAKLR